MNITGALKTIETTDSVNDQVNLLTGLNAILPFKALRDEIITSNIIYKTAHSILSGGVDDISVRVLAFLTRLLRAGAASYEAPARAHAPLARDMLRRSGCLQDMANMFLGTRMMYEETWKTLCECLVESCKDCVENQNYCSRLIPTCVQRCDVRNAEVLKLLHTLLLNHTRNVHWFIECNGLSIFTRETIGDCTKLELLSIVVQNSDAANLLKRNNALLKFLFTIGENCQGSLKMVEWASVILFHIASHIEGNDKTENSIEKQSEKIDTKNAQENTESPSSEETSNELSVSFLFKHNWEMAKTENLFKNTNTGNKITKYSWQNSISAKERSSAIDDQINLESSVVDFITEDSFIPNFVSTPKRKLGIVSERKITELNKVYTNIAIRKGNNAFRRDSCWNNTATVKKQKLSMSARLFNIVNNSCVSMYQMVGNILFQDSTHTKPQGDILKPKLDPNEGRLAYGFTNYMKQQVFHSAPKNDTILCQLKRKLCIKQKYRNDIVKKLKTGIHFYGCDFKKISRAMWPQEKQMTPQVLYSIYRKCIVK